MQKYEINDKEYAIVNRQTKRAIRKDVREYELQITKNILETSKSIKKTKRELSEGKFWMTGIKNKKGDKVTARTGINAIATDFYKELYDSKAQIGEVMVDQWKEEEEIPAILKREVEDGINHLKNNKTPGEDGILNECLKWGKEELLESITSLFNKILKTEIIPQQWFTNTIVLLHKKGKRDDLSNYRPISLMSNLYKIFTKILTRRLTRRLDENQPPERAGFRSSFSTMDHLQAVNQIVEKVQEYNIAMYMAFIDYKKAFDSVEHNSVISALEVMGTHPKYIRLIKKIYENSKAKVKTEFEGETFKIKKGVRQGDPISPKLFTCVLEIIFRKLNWTKKNFGININGRRLTNLRFADDIILFATSATKLEIMINELNDKSKEVGLNMNPAKTKLMTNSMERQVTVNGAQIEYCSEYIYLGQTISMTGHWDKEISRRIGQAWGKFWSLKYIILDKSIRLNLRLEILQSCVLTVLTYGSQTWSLTKSQTKKIQVCQRKMERKLLGINIMDRVRNEEVRKRSNIEDVGITAKQLKWRWGGHVARSEQQRWAYATTVWDPKMGKRDRGRPRRRWENDFAEELGKQWSRIARDRGEWHKIVERITKSDT